MTVILICTIVHLLIGYIILIVDALFDDYIEADTIIICFFWSMLLPVVIISKSRKTKRFFKKMRNKFPKNT